MNSIVPKLAIRWSITSVNKFTRHRETFIVMIEAVGIQSNSQNAILINDWKTKSFDKT